MYNLSVTFGKCNYACVLAFWQSFAFQILNLLYQKQVEVCLIKWSLHKTPPLKIKLPRLPMKWLTLIFNFFISRNNTQMLHCLKTVFNFENVNLILVIEFVAQVLIALPLLLWHICSYWIEIQNGIIFRLLLNTLNI